MIVSVTTDLPIAAERASELARRPALLRHVLWPWLALRPRGPLPDPVLEGDEISARVVFLGLLPGWTHTLRLVRVTPLEVASEEHGGPVRAWNHRLRFEPTGERSCRYTDEVEVQAGWLTPLVALFAHGMYRHRQARWRALAAILADA
jgi:ligand-binding SRPBCC domain-containing protein